MQDAGASNAEGIRRIVRKHDCALPAQYTKHSNARGHSLLVRVRVITWVRASSRTEGRVRATDTVENLILVQNSANFASKSR